MAPREVAGRDWLHTRLAGLTVTTAGMLADGVYIAATWERPHRTAMVGLVLLGFVVSAVVAALPAGIVPGAGARWSSERGAAR